MLCIYRLWYCIYFHIQNNTFFYTRINRPQYNSIVFYYYNIACNTYLAPPLYHLIHFFNPFTFLLRCTPFWSLIHYRHLQAASKEIPKTNGDVRNNKTCTQVAVEQIVVPPADSASLVTPMQNVVIWSTAYYLQLLPTSTTTYYHLHLPTYYSMSKTSRYMWNQSVTISIVIYQSSYLSLSLLSNSHCFSLFKSLCVSFFSTLNLKPQSHSLLIVIDHSLTRLYPVKHFLFFHHLHTPEDKDDSYSPGSFPPSLT